MSRTRVPVPAYDRVLTSLGRASCARSALCYRALLTAGAQAFAQQPPDGLNDQQRLGRQVFSQSCGVATCRPPVARELTARC